MKVIYIPDIHQDLTTFKKAIKRKADYYVCLGDYVDTFGPKVSEAEVKKAWENFIAEKQKINDESHLSDYESYVALAILEDPKSDASKRFFNQYVKTHYDWTAISGDYYKGNKVWWKSKKHNPINVINTLLDWKKEDPEHRILLMGNHDYSYLGYSDTYISGHQYNYEVEIRELFENNRQYFDILWQNPETGTIASHAGISAYMMTYLKSFNELVDEDNVTALVNRSFHNRTLINLDFRGRDSSGDDPSEFCLWIRPNSLISYNGIKNYSQVVGHTEYQSPVKCYIKSQHPRYVCIVESYGHSWIGIENKDRIVFDDLLGCGRIPIIKEITEE